MNASDRAGRARPELVLSEAEGGAPLNAIANCAQNLNKFAHRGCRCGKQKGRRAAAGMKIANRAKRFGGGLHGVAADSAVHMKIDEARREIISV